ncbi:hemolysin secretion protein D [Kiloniella litopenaei]|uniref:Membrane fusion protein (MFP) family protein n=1 Tax=Kiloniella litopenaei TaxID=1549748 RepID=A0A0M2R7S4_9PROT|nr:HlyD family type I secretion periplasmic adaptor subunit [Kiloniella litopenaei]KKJ76474.1 hemolysin secretion protein D [Kiloniella litopenaei]
MSSMSRKDEDLLFAPDLHAATLRKGRRIAYTLTFTAFLFFVIFGTWASMAELDEVTRGEGTFIPAQKTQIIQNLEGGIITELMVQEGDVVEKGDILLRIDNSQATSTVKDSNQQLKILSATVKRLTAELNDTPLEYTEAEKENAPEQVADQTSLYNARKLQQEAQIKVLENQSRQKRQEVAEVRSRIGQLRNSLALAREERNITKPLVDKGISPRLELIRIDRQVADLEGEIKTLRTSLPRLEGAVLEAKQRIDEMILTTKAEVSDELNRSRAEMKSLSERVAAGVDTVQRTDIRSPVRGTIKELKRNTVGGVIRPGEDIVEIVPLDDTLLVEAQIRPSDRAFLRSGQKATIKVTAYDFSIYGGLDGKLERISASTIKDEEGESFYRVYLRTEDNKIVSKGKELEIIPGMTANVEILTGKKTVMDYLLKPILKARDSALREK